MTYHRLLFTVLLTVLASATYAQALNQSSLSNIFGDHHCYGNRILRTARNGSLRDCTKAMLNSFPSDVDPGVFRRDGVALPGFHLPMRAEFDTCEVLIDLVNPATPIRTTWPFIVNAATLLIMSCRYPSQDAGGDKSGGWTTVGAGQGLRITIQKVGFSELALSGNATLEQALVEDDALSEE